MGPDEWDKWEKSEDEEKQQGSGIRSEVMKVRNENKEKGEETVEKFKTKVVTLTKEQNGNWDMSMEE